MAKPTSRISITDKVRSRVSSVMSDYLTQAERERQRKAFLASPWKQPKGKQGGPNRMYEQNEELLPDHGKEGENIHRRNR